MMNLCFNKVWGLSFFLFFSFIGLSLYASFHFNSQTRSLGGMGTDHFSHWGSAILFVEKGFEIYKKPISKLCDHDSPFWHNTSICILPSEKATSNPNSKNSYFINWKQYPRAYPLGNVLYHAPIAFLFSQEWVDFTGANWLTIEMYLLTAHLVFGLFFLLLFDEALNSASATVIKKIGMVCALSALCLSVYVLLMYWSLTGFYDGLSLFFLLLAILFYRQHVPAVMPHVI